MDPLGYTERQMADGFEGFLEQSRTRCGSAFSFDCVCREVACWPGRPDFLGIRGEMQSGIGFDLPLSPIACAVLSVLKPRATRTEKHIQSRLEVDTKATQAALRTLETNGYVVRTGQASYRLGPSSAFMDVGISAFELKLADTGRAVYQAVRNKEFSDRSYIVIPPERYQGYEAFEAVLRRWGIGLLTFSLLTGRVITVLRSRTVQPPDRVQAIRSKSKIMHSAVSRTDSRVCCPTPA